MAGARLLVLGGVCLWARLLAQQAGRPSRSLSSCVLQKGFTDPDLSDRCTLSKKS